MGLMERWMTRGGGEWTGWDDYLWGLRHKAFRERRQRGAMIREQRRFLRERERALAGE